MTLAEALGEMLDEMESCRLEVVLAPQKIRTNEGGMIRVVVCRNVDWYRKLCANNLSRRTVRRGKPDTIIRRAHVLRELRRLVASVEPKETLYSLMRRDGGRVYAVRLLHVAGLRMKEPKRKAAKRRWDVSVEDFDSKSPF